MNNGLLRGTGRRASSTSTRAGLVIATARSAAAQTGVSGTTLALGTDVTGLAIAFTVYPDETVWVDSRLSFAFHSASGGTVAVGITDAANTALGEAWGQSPAANGLIELFPNYEISTPGDYALKLRGYKAATAGTVGWGTDARFAHFLRATVIR